MLERRSQLRELLSAADERRFQPPGDCRRTLYYAHQPPRAERAPVLEADRLERLDAHRVPNEAVRRGAQQDLARRRGVLEPLRDPEGRARCDHSECGRVADEDLPRIDADPDAEVEAAFALKLGAERRQPFA